MVTEISPGDLETEAEAPIYPGRDIFGCKGRAVVIVLIGVDEEMQSDGP